MIDGNPGREIFWNTFHSMTFGGFAVNCFFIVSGYLISASFLNSSSVTSYLTKRIARIYPAFIAVFIISAFIVAPLSGADIPSNVSALGRLLHDCLLLQKPTVEGVFSGQPYPTLNGSLWTISYEFRCYLLVIALGLLGVLQRRSWLMGATLLCLAGTLIFPIPTVEGGWSPTDVLPPADMSGYSLHDLRVALIGNNRQNLRLVSMFLAGACFYAYQDKIEFSKALIGASTLGLILSLFHPISAHIGMMLFGSYLIFAIAQIGGRGILSRINNENDVSYGVYLYAWPVAKLLNWWFPTAPLAAVIVATFVISWACGWASWLLIEKPVMEVIRGRKKFAGPASVAV